MLSAKQVMTAEAGKINILTVSRGTIFGKEKNIICLWKIFQVSQFYFLSNIHSTVIFEG